VNGRRGLRALALAGAAIAGACGSVGPYTLAPAPSAGGGQSPITVRISQVALSTGIDAADASLGPQSRIAVTMEVTNTETRWPVAIGRLGLIVRDVRGGPDIYAGPIERDDTGLVPVSEQPASGPLTIGPGQTATVRAVFAGFPVNGPSAPLRATVVVPVQGGSYLQVAIADPGLEGPRWIGPVRAAQYLTSSYGFLGSTPNAVEFFDPVAWSWRRSFGRFIGGVDWRWSFVRREAQPDRTFDLGFSLLGDLQWQPWTSDRLGLYLQAGAFGGFQSDSQGGGSQLVGFPRASAGVVFASGDMLGSNLFSHIERPRSPQRRYAIRVGYAHWLNTGERGGSGGVQISIEALLNP
jgi:hypothetical protein